MVPKRTASSERDRDMTKETRPPTAATEKGDVLEFAVAVCCLPEDFFSGFSSNPAEFLAEPANRAQAHWVVGVVEAANEDQAAFDKALEAWDEGKLSEKRKPGDHLVNWHVTPLNKASKSSDGDADSSAESTAV
jgi:hypothetical protein